MRMIMAMLASAVIAPPVMAAGNATSGQHDFSRCAACHSTEPNHNGIGPSLAGIAGRQSGSESGYRYSPALSSAHITWNDTTLDSFLRNPQGLVHGTKMFIAIPDAQQRQDIIAYLDSLK